MQSGELGKNESKNKRQGETKTKKLRCSKFWFCFVHRVTDLKLWPTWSKVATPCKRSSVFAWKNVTQYHLKPWALVTDILHAKLLFKQAFACICQNITVIINTSLNPGKVPLNFKKLVVEPLLKIPNLRSIAVDIANFLPPFPLELGSVLAPILFCIYMLRPNH